MQNCFKSSLKYTWLIGIKIAHEISAWSNPGGVWLALNTPRQDTSIIIYLPLTGILPATPDTNNSNKEQRHLTNLSRTGMLGNPLQGNKPVNISSVACITKAVQVSPLECIIHALLSSCKIIIHVTNVSWLKAILELHVHNLKVSSSMLQFTCKTLQQNA